MAAAERYDFVRERTMSNPYNLERQERKRRLKQHMVSDPAPREIEDLDETIRENRSATLRRWAILCGVILLLIVVIRGMVSVRTYTSYTVAWEEAGIGGSDASYEMFADGILKVTGDGISVMATDGTVLWNHGYTMKHPRVLVRGDYGAVADIQSQTAIIFGKNGVTGTVETTKPILDFGVSSVGVLVLELDDSSVNYINFYDNTGRALDIRIKTKLSGDGYPLSISLSPEGTGLMSSVVYLDQGVMQNRITFYNFDVGKSNSDRTVGYFTYGETMFPEVQYLSNSRAVAFGDDEVNIFSLRKPSEPVEIRSIPFDTSILSVFSGKNAIGVVSNVEEGGRKVTIYDAAGRVKGSCTLDFEYSHVEFSGNYVVFTNGSDCVILNQRGRIKFRGSLGTKIEKVVMQSDDSCLVFSDTSLRKLRLK